MRRLRKAYLEITNVCNLACDFCPGTQRAPGFLSPEGFRTLAGRLRPHTDYLYLHLMGEPLLHPQLGDLLEEADALGFRVMLTTNGTLLRQREALLLGSPAVKKVSVSVHSFEGNGGGGEDLDGYLDGCISFGRGGEAVRPAAVEPGRGGDRGGQPSKRPDPLPAPGGLSRALAVRPAWDHHGPGRLSGIW